LPKNIATGGVFLFAGFFTYLGSFLLRYILSGYALFILLKRHHSGCHYIRLKKTDQVFKTKFLVLKPVKISAACSSLLFRMNGLALALVTTTKVHFKYKNAAQAQKIAPQFLAMPGSHNRLGTILPGMISELPGIIIIVNWCSSWVAVPSSSELPGI
jgi:hypothetical protein